MKAKQKRSVLERFQLGKLLLWIALITVAWWLGRTLPEPDMPIALAALAGAIVGTVLFGEERLPFVLFSVVLVLVTKVIDFEHFVEGAEWVLFLKLVGLLSWVDTLYKYKYFDWLIERLLPKGMKGYKLFIVLSVLAFISAALIDEVNSIVIMYFLTRAIIGYAQERFLMNDQDWGRTTVALVSSTNIGSQLLPLGNPVGIAVASIAGFSAAEFIRFAWIPAIITLVFYLWLVRRSFPDLVADFGNVEVEDSDFQAREAMGHAAQGEYEITEVRTNGHQHVIEHEKPPFAVLTALFLFGVIGLVISQPIGLALGYEGTTAVGAFAVLLWGVTLYVASSYGEHNESVLKSLPWSTLLFIVLLFAIAHVLEQTGITELAAQSIYNLIGDNKLLMLIAIAIVGSLVTAVMDNVIAIAVLSGIILQLESLGLNVTVLWFGLLSAGVVAANATPIGSAANIIANAQARLTWGQWWRFGGWMAPVVTLVNVAVLYIWIVIIQGQ